MIPGDCRKAASLLGDLEFTSLISSVFLRGDFEVSRRGLINFTVRYCICASKALLGIEFSCDSLVLAFPFYRSFNIISTRNKSVINKSLPDQKRSSIKEILGIYTYKNGSTGA